MKQEKEKATKRKAEEIKLKKRRVGKGRGRKARKRETKENIRLVVVFAHFAQALVVSAFAVGRPFCRCLRAIKGKDGI